MLRSGHGELTGRKLWELYPDAQGTLVQEECERAKREQASVQFEHYSRALGRWFEMSAYPADPGLSVFFRDVTERKQTEALVREAHALLDAFFENAPVGLGLWDRDLRFVRVNQALAEINGVPVEAHAGRTLHELLPRMGPEVLSAFKRVFDTGEPLTGAEASGETPAAPGKILCFSVSYYPIRDGDEVRFVSAICEDITERKAAETALRAVTEELHRANSDLRLFAYAASHDLQEPLRMVTSYLGLLSRRYGNSLGDDARDFIGYAVDGARRMEMLLEDLREYWRAASPADTPPSLTSMDSALDTALGNLAAAIHEADAVVTREPLPNVLANETPLVQVFQNLISNAIKYRRKERPTVHISAERDGEAMWRFSVRDNGIGIPREHAIDVFTAFKRLHGREVPGTGLGLVICAKIIERYGGSIWVESEAGAGSTFRFTLPAADGRA
jgi:PAS domain S-box-containing protein